MLAVSGIAIVGLIDESEEGLEDLQPLGLVDGGVYPHMSKG